jgi:5'-nucleotidase
MNILVTNDDGIKAEGIHALRKELSRNHRVFLIAPDQERSGCSNAFHINHPLTVEKVGDDIYTVSGYPADCVNIGIHSGMIPEVQCIVSGINHGPNLGDDVHFSGTAAGARTGLVMGKSGIAVSIDAYHRVSPYLEDAARFVSEFISLHEQMILGNRAFFNINYPELPRHQVKGLRYTSLGKRIYNDVYRQAPGSGASTHMTLEGEITSIHRDGTDVTELAAGYVSVTPLTIDATDSDLLQQISTRGM